MCLDCPTHHGAAPHHLHCTNTTYLPMYVRMYARMQLMRCNSSEGDNILHCITSQHSLGNLAVHQIWALMPSSCHHFQVAPSTQLVKQEGKLEQERNETPSSTNDITRFTSVCIGRFIIIRVSCKCVYCHADYE